MIAKLFVKGGAMWVEGFVRSIMSIAENFREHKRWMFLNIWLNFQTQISIIPSSRSKGRTTDEDNFPSNSLEQAHRGPRTQSACNHLRFNIHAAKPAHESLSLVTN